MELLILKTNIKTKKKVHIVQPILNSHPIIKRWSIDLEDIDNVLRIEAREHISESEIKQLINKAGFLCEALPDI